jgi:hypothetical protein
MKKITLALMVLLSTGASLLAQDTKYKISPFISPNMSWLQPDQKFIESEGSVPRFGFGLAIDVMFTDNYAIGTGLNISRTGGELTYLEQGSIADVPVIWEKNRAYHLQYAEIPLTLKLRTNEIGYITYWGQFGLGLGMNIHAKGDDEIDYKYQKGTDDQGVVWTDATLPNLISEEEDIKGDIAIFRTSLIVGAGIEYNVSGNTSIVAGVLFNNGFSDALKGDGVRTDSAGLVEYDQNRDPVTYDLKGLTNFVELRIGILF